MFEKINEYLYCCIYEKKIINNPTIKQDKIK